MTMFKEHLIVIVSKANINCSPLRAVYKPPDSMMGVGAFSNSPSNNLKVRMICQSHSNILSTSIRFLFTPKGAASQTQSANPFHQRAHFNAPSRRKAKLDKAELKMPALRNVMLR